MIAYKTRNLVLERPEKFIQNIKSYTRFRDMMLNPHHPSFFEGKMTGFNEFYLFSGSAAYFETHFIKIEGKVDGHKLKLKYGIPIGMLLVFILYFLFIFLLFSFSIFGNLYMAVGLIVFLIFSISGFRLLMKYDEKLNKFIHRLMRDDFSEEVLLKTFRESGNI